MMSVFYHFQHTLNRLFNKCITLYWCQISSSWDMKERGGGGGQIDPQPEIKLILTKSFNHVSHLKGELTFRNGFLPFCLKRIPSPKIKPSKMSNVIMNEIHKSSSSFKVFFFWIKAENYKVITSLVQERNTLL